MLCLPRRVTALALFWLGLTASSGAETLRFSHLTQDDGLPINAVRTTYQDAQGFLWVGTHEGLARYDGYEFRTFRFDPRDEHSLSDNVVTRITETPDGELWVATLNGLNRFDRRSERFIRVGHGHAGPDRLYALQSDGHGGLWIGCERGLTRLDLASGTAVSFGPAEHMAEGEVRDLALAGDGTLWVAAFGGGLARRDPATGRFDVIAASPGGLPENRVSALALDGDTLWIGTRSQGVATLDLRDGRWQSFAPDPARAGALADGAITSLWRDRRGVVWVGTFEGGLYRYNATTGLFSRFRHNPGDPASLSHDTVRGIYEDRSNVLWIATRQGLDKYDTARARFTLIAHEADDPDSLSHNTIGAVLEARDGSLWVGTQPGGLNHIDRNTGKAVHYRNDPARPNSLGDDLVWSLLEDREGRLWVGTSTGLNRFRPATGDFQRYPVEAGGPGGQVQWLFQDSDGQIWIAADDGLRRLDPATGRFEHFRHDPANPASLSSDRVGQIAEDEQGRLWLAFDGELNRLDRRTGAITRVRPTDPNEIGANTEVGYLADDGRGGYWLTTTRGLKHFSRKTGEFRSIGAVPAVPLFGVVTDGQGAVWVSGNNGLYRYEPASDTARTYYAEDGLQGNEYNAGAFHKSRRGELFFGGVNGLSAFFPDNLGERGHAAPVVLTGLRLYNRPLAIGSRLLPAALNELRELSLDYQDDVVALSFAGLDLASPAQNRYAWRLVGLNEAWIESDARDRNAVFTDLSPGDYQFEVRAGDRYGEWSPEVRRLAIHVAPPPWRTPYAYAVYALMIAGLLLLVFRRQQAKLREQSLQAERLRVAVNERTAELRARNAAIQGLLDNAGQGFLSFGAELRVERDYSGECERLLGTAVAGRYLPELLYPDQPEASGFLGALLRDVLAADEPGQRALFRSLLPEEILLSGRPLRFELRELGSGRAMAVLTDLSGQRALESQVASEHRRLRMVLKAVLDPRLVQQVEAEFRQFIASGAPDILAHAPDPDCARRELFRAVHTFKANFAQLEFAATAARLAELEQRLAAGEALAPFPGGELAAAVDDDRQVLDDYLGPEFLARQARPRLEPAVLEAFETQVRHALGHEAATTLAPLLARLRLVDFRELLAGYPALVAELAEQGGKALAPLAIEGDECLVAPGRFGVFARTLGHVFRNLVDHGIEDPETRLAAGKPLLGQLRCQLIDAGATLELALSDDGAGIDTAAVRERARASGLRSPEWLAAASDADIWDLVFEDGLSTRLDVTELSGRGVGLAAVRAEVQRLGGWVRVASIVGRGTSFLFSLPKSE